MKKSFCWLLVSVVTTLAWAVQAAEKAEVPTAPTMVVEASATLPDNIPVEIGEAVIKITIPLVINDDNIVIRTELSREKPEVREGQICPWSMEVFYPLEWGRPAVYPHSTSAGQASGVYTLTFGGNEEGWEGGRSISFTLDIAHPLSNLDREEQAKLTPKLTKVFGPKVAKEFTLHPKQWLVEWKSTEHRELRKIAGLENAEDELLSTEVVELPPQVGGQPPFSLVKVGMNWGVINRRETQTLASLAEVAPYLGALKNSSPIRVMEGYLEYRFDPNFQGIYAGGAGRQWVLLRDRTLIRVVPYLEYSIAQKK